MPSRRWEGSGKVFSPGKSTLVMENVLGIFHNGCSSSISSRSIRVSTWLFIMKLGEIFGGKTLCGVGAQLRLRPSRASRSLDSPHSVISDCQNDHWDECSHHLRLQSLLLLTVTSLLWLSELVSLFRLQGGSLPCNLSVLMVSIKASGFPFVQLFLLRTVVITSKLFTWWWCRWKFLLRLFLSSTLSESRSVVFHS